MEMELPLCKGENDSEIQMWISHGNGSSFPALRNISTAKQSDEYTPSMEWYQIVVPVICAFGVAGNLLNLVVLTRQRLLSRMDRLERSATYGMVGLAVSDMLFCITAFPHGFITQKGRIGEPGQMYYRLYGVSLINLFLMTSTWLVVFMAASRFIVVAYPFQARRTLGTARCVIAMLLIGVVSTILTLPFFVRHRVIACRTTSGVPMREFRALWSETTRSFLSIYVRWLWPIFADYIPLIILIVINIRLITELQTARTRRIVNCNGQILRDGGQRVTMTLVIIILMLVFLVTPGEIMRYINPYKSWGDSIGHTVAAIANVLQTLNFAFNFVLYCVMGASFRHTTRELVSCVTGRSPEEKYMLTHVNGSSRRMTVLLANDDRVQCQVVHNCVLREI